MVSYSLQGWVVYGLCYKLWFYEYLVQMYCAIQASQETLHIVSLCAYRNLYSYRLNVGVRVYYVQLRVDFVYFYLYALHTEGQVRPVYCL